MTKYNHLSREQRDIIDRFLRSEVSPILSVTMVARANCGVLSLGGIFTLTDRKMGYAIIEKFPNGKNARSLARVVNRSLAHFKRIGLLHSMTTDPCFLPGIICQNGNISLSL